jgi:hypothetical protein
LIFSQYQAARYRNFHFAFIYFLFQSREDLYRLHPDKKTKLKFCLQDATEADGLQLQDMLFEWFETFQRDHSIEIVDTSLFWYEFYNFFVSQVFTNHNGINIIVQQLNVNCGRRAKKMLLEKNELIKKIVSEIDLSADKEATLNRELDEGRNNGMSSINNFRFPYLPCNDPAIVANIANDYLVSKMNDKFKTPSHARHYRSFKPFVLTQSKVEKAIDNLKSVPASGMLVMTSEMLKLTKKASALILYHIFKRSMSEGKLPDDWRHTLVRLKHKDGARDQLANYRPIGITCVPSKVSQLNSKLL